MPAKCLYKNENLDGTFDYVVDKQRGVNTKGHEVCAAVKTNHAWYPKTELEAEMRDIPSGTYLTLACKCPDTNVDLIAIGYKYNAKKVLCFVMTKNAGRTTPGRPYVAKFADKYGNVSTRNVPRPDVLSQYFSYSNAIDRHNQVRQHFLGLERRWRTTNCWFRLNWNDCC